MLQWLTGEDEHTGADGAYNRMLKARKWLVLSGVAAALHSYKLFDFIALKKLTGSVVTIPTWMATLGIASGLAYLTVQYALLIVQLAGSYKLIIRLRLPEAFELANLRQAITRADKELKRREKQEAEDRARSIDYPADWLEQYETETANLIRVQSLNQEGLAEFERDEPTKKPWFIVPEYLIDAFRITVPMAIALSGLIHLYFSRPGFP